MKNQYCKLDFAVSDWTASAAGGRSKVISHEDRQFRVVELARASYSPEVCLVGHLGYIIDGEMRIDFDDGSITLKTGDGLDIPDGEPHTPHPVSEKVVLFLSEKIG
jgi:quercetin dioxygenase-like cupin family protein